MRLLIHILFILLLFSNSTASGQCLDNLRRYHFKSVEVKKLSVGDSLPVICRQGDSVSFPSDYVASDRAVAVFAQAPKSKYAFDIYNTKYAESLLFSEKYEELRTNGSEAYQVPFKLIPAGATDVVQVTITPAVLKEGLEMKAINPDKIIFRTANGAEYKPKPVSDDKGRVTMELTLPAAKENDGYELYALHPVYAANTNGYEYDMLGKLTVVSYAMEKPKVVLVAVNGNTIDENAVKTYLDKVYLPVGVNWQVGKTVEFDYDIPKDSLDVTGSGLFSRYTPAMKRMNAAFMQREDYDVSTLYIFVLQRASLDNTSGDMPRGCQFGYIFTGAITDAAKSGMSKNEIIGRTIAHELGHGMFKLKHTFDSEYRIAESTTDNLMDYNWGTDYVKHQWDAIHAPGLVIGMFERDEDAMMEFAEIDCKSLPNKDQIEGALKTISFPTDISSLVKYIDELGIWNDADIEKNIQVTRDELMKDFYINFNTSKSAYRFDKVRYREMEINAYKALSASQQSNYNMTQMHIRQEYAEIRAQYLLVYWDDLLFNSTNKKLCVKYDEKISLVEKKQQINELCGHFPGTCYLADGEKFKSTKGRESEFPDACMYFNTEKQVYEMEKFKADLRRYVNTKQAVLIGGNEENSTLLQYNQEAALQTWAEIMSKFGYLQIEGANTQQQNTIRSEFNRLWRQTNKMDYYWRWNTLKDERLEQERQAYLARLRGEQALKEYLDILEQGRIGAYVDIGIGGGGLVLTGILFFSSEVTLGTSTIVAIGSAGYSIDQISGGIKKLQAIEKGLFDPNKEYKVVKGLIIDEFGENAGIMYDVTRIKGSDIEGILRAINAELNTYNIGNTTIELKNIK